MKMTLGTVPGMGYQLPKKYSNYAGIQTHMKSPSLYPHIPFKNPPHRHLLGTY